MGTSSIAEQFDCTRLQQFHQLDSINMKLIVLALMVCGAIAAPQYNAYSNQQAQVVSRSEPEYQPAPAYSKPEYQPAPAYSKPEYQPAPVYSEPKYQPANEYQTQQVYSEPEYQPAKATNEYQTQQVYSEPEYQPAAPVYSKTVDVTTMMPMPFNFAWAVQDAPSANDYEQKASSDGETVTGSYRVALPDGRTQIVTYTADSNGYVAQVTYEGEAKYPEQKSLSSASAYDQSAYRPSSSDQNQSY